MNDAQVNIGYELYQIITDFGEPLEIFREAFQNAFDENATKIFCHVYEKKRMSGTELIIDIWNNGEPLKKENIDNFFGLAKSTKINEDNMPLEGKLGYKGHGSKIFFNASKVHICSKNHSEEWAVELDSPLEQLETKNIYSYSDVCPASTLGIALPNDWEQGFMVRIIAPRHFNTQHTKFKLNHAYLRDYIKWYTVVGSLRPLFDKKLQSKDIKLYLAGLKQDDFSRNYCSLEMIDPIPTFETINGISYEIITLGHYFPPNRYSESAMKSYAKSIKSNKAYYDYYSRTIYNDTVVCSNNTSFRLIIHLEGYETKRKYDILLSKRGRARNELTHTDSERYGLWVCKGGVPVEKVDDWIEGGKGSGSYTYMQAFIDCDDFQLTANRGSIQNSEIEKIEIIKSQLNTILNDSSIKSLMNERSEMEQLEKQIQSIENDQADLQIRNKLSQQRKTITLPCGRILLEPTKLKTGYSESETMILLIQIMTLYPKLFTFNLLDYNTSKGIDFVVDINGTPKYIELKGTLNKKINHPFRYIDRFICYDINLKADDIVNDIEDFDTKLTINRDDKFASFDNQFKNNIYKSYQLIPSSSQIKSMEIIVLKEILINILHAKIQ